VSTPPFIFRVPSPLVLSSRSDQHHIVRCNHIIDLPKGGSARSVILGVFLTGERSMVWGVRIIRESLEARQMTGLTIEVKGGVDLVTETDKMCEELIISTLRDAYPVRPSVQSPPHAIRAMSRKRAGCEG
jgi:hypothetical protein